MRLAGRYLSAAQELADAAALSPLRFRQIHKGTNQPTYDNIQNLANMARTNLKESMEAGIIKRQAITPKMLYKAASDLISNVETLHDEMIGIPYE